MIVPSTRLILLAALVLLPVGFMAAGHPELTGSALMIAMAVVLVAVLDGISGQGRVTGLDVQAPAVIRMTVDRPARIDLLVSNPEGMRSGIRIGLALPRAIASDQTDLRLVPQSQTHACATTWPCRALRRGRYAVTRCHLEVSSALGLWAVRRRFALQSEIRAYPNLVSGQQHLAGLFRRRHWGLRTQRRVGKGREFEQLRDYLPGDSFEDIDWKATARRRHPITKVYQVEQAQEIYVVLDASRLSTRSAAFIMDRRLRERQDNTGPEITIFERYITAALVMSVVADQVADLYGLLVFGDKPECFIKAGRGRAHYNACRDALYNRMPRTVSPDFDELFTFVGTHLRKRALLVFLTSLDDPVLADGFIRAMRAACRQHILMVNMFRPPGAHPLFGSADIKQVQGIYQHLMGHVLWSSLNETHRRFKQHGVGFTLLDNVELCGQLVNQYMEVKQRQIL